MAYAGGPHSTIAAMLGNAALQRPGATAIVAPDREPLTYGRLWEQARGVADWLDTRGVRSSDRVAIALQNGPELATALLGTSMAAIAVPLNSAHTVRELEDYLAELAPKVVITQIETNTAIRAIAAAQPIPIVELTPCHDVEAGIFRLDGDVVRATNRRRDVDGNSVALLIRTSGTTSQPKRVPLTHDNLCWSANNIARSLELSEDDRCLNVLPLLYTHGIVGALLASLSSGGSVACSPGFDEIHFFQWINELKATWYTAVPTIHQAVMRRGEQAGEVMRRHLRFVRSSSAPLSEALLSELEACFGVPVINSYGMTEACQIASTRLSSSIRRRASVGLVVGCDVAILDQSGTFLPPDAPGEIAVRGRNVFGGYEHNAEANARTFLNGWCRTGDCGTLDAEGYLSVTGRLKDIINRGGEKIAPLEIDQVLLAHPDVREAVAFAIPHPTLGESIVAAVTVREGRTVSEIAVRDFAATHLPDSKIPDRILVVDTIPTGPTGKVRRTQLAEHFAEALTGTYKPPVDRLEQSCVAAFEQLLELASIGRNDNFFALGGDSIRATQVISRLAEEVGIDLQPTILFRHPTAALLASEVRRLLQRERDMASFVDELRTISPADAIQIRRISAGSADEA